MTAATEQLTAKQQRVVNLLREGRTVPEIAKALKITTSGVYGHMRNIRRAGVKIPGEQMDDATAESNGHSEEAPVFNGEAIHVDVPTVIRSQIEQVKDAIDGIEREATEMAERAKALHLERERLQEAVEHHQAALSAYGVK